MGDGSVAPRKRPFSGRAAKVRHRVLFVSLAVSERTLVRGGHRDLRHVRHPATRHDVAASDQVSRLAAVRADGPGRRRHLAGRYCAPAVAKAVYPGAVMPESGSGRAHRHDSNRNGGGACRSTAALEHLRRRP